MVVANNLPYEAQPRSEPMTGFGLARAVMAVGSSAGGGSVEALLAGAVDAFD